MKNSKVKSKYTHTHAYVCVGYFILRNGGTECIKLFEIFEEILRYGQLIVFDIYILPNQKYGKK